MESSLKSKAACNQAEVKRCMFGERGLMSKNSSLTKLNLILEEKQTL